MSADARSVDRISKTFCQRQIDQRNVDAGSILLKHNSMEKEVGRIAVELIRFLALKIGLLVFLVIHNATYITISSVKAGVK